DLVANVCHDGKPERGTYKVQVFHQPTSQWFEIHDLRVTPVLPQMVALTESYIQVYQRQDVKPDGSFGKFDAEIPDLLAEAEPGVAAEIEMAPEESTNDLRSFLDQLHRRLSEQLELQQQQQENRHAWCHKNLQFLADEGKHAEGIIESLRGTIRKLKNTKDENILLVQLTEEAKGNATTQSQELALQLSTKAARRSGKSHGVRELRQAQLAEAQEPPLEARYKEATMSDLILQAWVNCKHFANLCGLVSNSSLGSSVEATLLSKAAEKRSAEQQKALEDQISLLRTSTEAISAAEALHRIDESKVSSSLGEVSFLQMTTERAAEIPDLLSLFRRPEPANSEDLEELSLPFQSRPSEAHMQEVLPAMPQDQRPRVVELLAKMQSDDSLERSKKMTWCSEERQRERASLESARASAMLFSADAHAHEHIKAQLQDELDHMQKTSENCDGALRTILQDATNVLNKALDGLTSLRDQWWGHDTNNPVVTAMTSLSGVKQSFEAQAEACEGLQKESAESAKAVAERARDLLAALDAEGRKLELMRDFYAKRQSRSTSMKDVYDSQVISAEAYLRNLDQSCGTGVLEQQSHETQADVHALNDADMVFNGQPIKAPHLLRGSSKSLSPVEEAALAMGVSID
ncbi:USP39, partial [Symbiodinium necroappetens]